MNEVVLSDKSLFVNVCEPVNVTAAFAVVYAEFAYDDAEAAFVTAVFA